MTAEEKGDRGGVEVITQLEVAGGAQLSGVGPIWLYSQCLFSCAGGVGGAGRHRRPWRDKLRERIELRITSDSSN